MQVQVAMSVHDGLEKRPRYSLINACDTLSEGQQVPLLFITEDLITLYNAANYESVLHTFVRGGGCILAFLL